MKVFLTETVGDKRIAGPRIIAPNGHAAELMLDVLIEEGELPVNTYLKDSCQDPYHHVSLLQA